MGYYHKGEVQRAKVILYLHDYFEKHGTYPRRREIADYLGVSLTYGLTLVGKMIAEGVVLTQPPWNKTQRQWTVITGLKRGSVRSAEKVLSSLHATT